MNNRELHKELTKTISEVALITKDPEKMAHKIYLVFKQYPSQISGNGTYGTILDEIKSLLNSKYGWTMREIHACFCLLGNLTKYLKKTLDKKVKE